MAPALHNGFGLYSAFSAGSASARVPGRWCRNRPRLDEAAVPPPTWDSWAG